MKRFFTEGGALGILAGVVMIAAIFGGKDLTQRRAPESAYRDGLMFLEKMDRENATRAFDFAINNGNLPKAKLMKATLLILFGEDAEACGIFFEDLNHPRSADTWTPEKAADVESQARTRIEILDVALKTEPTIKVLWILKADSLAGLHVEAIRQKKDADQYNARLRAIKKCYDEAHRLDPSYQLALDRLAQSWVKTLPPE